MKFSQDFVDVLDKNLESPSVRFKAEKKRHEDLSILFSEVPGVAYLPIDFVESGSVGDEFKSGGRKYDTIFVSGKDASVYGSDMKHVGNGFTTKFRTRFLEGYDMLEAYFILVDSSKNQNIFDKLLNGKSYHAIPKNDFKEIKREHWEQRYADATLNCPANEVSQKYPTIYIR